MVQLQEDVPHQPVATTTPPQYLHFAGSGSYWRLALERLFMIIFGFDFRNADWRVVAVLALFVLFLVLFFALK